MLTPRRTLMLIAGFALFGLAYLGYSQLLGWIDGLPQLPDEMRQCGPSTFRPPERTTSPTQHKLSDAFGDNALETDYVHYPNQFSRVNDNSVVVIACGAIPADPNSTRVPVSPFSVAIFGKPKPLHLLKPGEVTEISTVHADKAILEFDRVIHNPNDMRAAKLVRMELVSDAEIAGRDPRAGVVHITNNQRSRDPDRRLILRTPGPVFYRDPKAVAGTPQAQGPDFWTDAAVEIVDQQNIPRAIGSESPTTAPGKAADLRTTAVVANIIAGRRAPPPTVTAVGLRIYLEPEPLPGQPRPKPKKDGGVQGVRRIEFLEKVLMNLWVDNGQSLVGGAPAPAPGSAPEPKSNSLAMTPPPAALAALGGLGPAAYTSRLMNRALLQIDTRGPFAYDAEKSLARFDVVPQSDPNLPNDVQVTKVPARGGTSSLFSQVLELEFNGGPTSAGRPANAPAIKRLHAWTYSPGRLLTLTSQDDAAQAYGQDLVHDRAANRTVLTGSPLYVVRDKSSLTAGTKERAATLTAEPGPTPGAKQQVTVNGPGRVEMFDKSSGANTVAASWQTSLVQSKEVVSGREQDLFVFTDGAKFEDLKADYWLKGNVLKLWLEPRADAQPEQEKVATVASPTGGSAKPSKVQAVGNVTSHSAEYDIEQAEQLNVFFSDAKPVVAKGGPIPQPARPEQPGPGAVAAAPGPPAPKPAEKPKPPLKIRAKDIQTWVTRVPVPVDPDAKPPVKDADAPARVKYQLDRARCEDNVVIHQEPADPAKPRGIDILARLLLIDGSPDGNVMTVFGWPGRPGEVHHEEMSLIGPEVKLDQLHNAAEVKGRGALRMPTNSDLSGGQLKQSEVVVIHWRDRMEFKGALRSAEFEGKVSAWQGQSELRCNTMHVTFDRPVYFNQAQKKPARTGEKEEKPKIDTVRCYPVPGDAADNREELSVYFRQVEVDDTGKVTKSQRLFAMEICMEAQAQDPASEGKYQRVTAFGPGEVRIWQLGEKDAAGPAPRPQPPGANPAPAKREQEMKLTVVEFNRAMTAIDKGKLFQQATFTDLVKAINAPAPQENTKLDPQNLPRGGILLKCNKELVVWSHKKPGEPTVQRLDATGNASIRSDDYEGWGELISNDGKLVRLRGSEAVPAQIRNRFNRGNDQSGKLITYDRETGAFSTTGSLGGTLGTPPK